MVMAKKTDDVKRPSLAYYLAHVKDEHLLLVENVDPEASPTDRAAFLESVYRDARWGTPAAEYLAWLHWREQAEGWVRRRTTVVEPTADMWRAFWAYQQELTGKEYAIDLLAVALWWWTTYGIVNWQLDSGLSWLPSSSVASV